ncbi:MAG TPA: hypothetical protein VFK54_09405 [Candidatus Limnocylindrales bacterium]|nr:hypothetical protein [Candidatus Limnocylindrales bacterium]
MSTNAPRITPRSLIAPADLELFRAAVVELPPDESLAPGRLPAFVELRRHLRRLVSATEIIADVTPRPPERA